ncbi:MAG: hypothetical protein CM1200mP26_00500 [Acidimicrobiales bacterium]|nr:MAG: hypothetical protein CM1200mP26_00500 [Acidimicrobiales bacterium]
MSWFTGDDGTRYELFGSGGGQALADRIGVLCWVRCRWCRPARRADRGQPVADDPSPEVGAVFAEIARVLDVEMKPTSVGTGNSRSSERGRPGERSSDVRETE